MISICLQREYQSNHNTVGKIIVLDGPIQVFEAYTLERPWVDNERMVSCVPAGMYEMRYEYSPKFNRNLWELKDVPNRSEIKFHAAN